MSSRSESVISMGSGESVAVGIGVAVASDVAVGDDVSGNATTMVPSVAPTVASTRPAGTGVVSVEALPFSSVSVRIATTMIKITKVPTRPAKHMAIHLKTFLQPPRSRAGSASEFAPTGSSNEPPQWRQYAAVRDTSPPHELQNAIYELPANGISDTLRRHCISCMAPG